MDAAAEDSSLFQSRARTSAAESGGDGGIDVSEDETTTRPVILDTIHEQQQQQAARTVTTKQHLSDNEFEMSEVSTSPSPNKADLSVSSSSPVARLRRTLTTRSGGSNSKGSRQRKLKRALTMTEIGRTLHVPSSNTAAAEDKASMAATPTGDPTGDPQDTRSKVMEMLEDFPEENTDCQYAANFLDHKSVNMNEILCLDVGGDKYRVRRGCLTRLPHTRLGRLARCATIADARVFCDIGYERTPPEYFFDRNGENFSSILDIYRTNMFHLAVGGCALVLQKDLEYWGIDELMMEPCCALKYYPEIEICHNEKQGDMEHKAKEEEREKDENFGNSWIGQTRTWIWKTMEYPWTSKLAQFVAFFSLGMVVLSTLTFVISTMEDNRDPGEAGWAPFITVTLDWIDTFVIIFFTMEYVIRFVCAPRKWRFFKGPMNLVDVLAIMPFFLSLLLAGLEDVLIIGKAGKIIRLIRVMRILRIFKLVRHFAGLQSLFMTLRQAYKELGLLFLLVAVGILTFSSLVYFAEKEGYDQDKEDGRNPDFTWTFAESFWWGLMTITTVGYDLNPRTYLGKLIGGFTAISGIFILTLPIPIVVNSFASYYKNRLWRNEVAQKKREMFKAAEAEAKEMQKFNMFRALAMPMAGMTMEAPKEAVKKRAEEAVGREGQGGMHFS